MTDDKSKKRRLERHLNRAYDELHDVRRNLDDASRLDENTVRLMKERAETLRKRCDRLEQQLTELPACDSVTEDDDYDVMPDDSSESSSTDEGAEDQEEPLREDAASRIAVAASAPRSQAGGNSVPPPRIAQGPVTRSGAGRQDSVWKAIVRQCAECNKHRILGYEKDGVPKLFVAERDESASGALVEGRFTCRGALAENRVLLETRCEHVDLNWRIRKWLQSERPKGLSKMRLCRGVPIDLGALYVLIRLLGGSIDLAKRVDCLGLKGHVRVAQLLGLPARGGVDGVTKTHPSVFQTHGTQSRHTLQETLDADTAVTAMVDSVQSVFYRTYLMCSEDAVVEAKRQLAHDRIQGVGAPRQDPDQLFVVTNEIERIAAELPDAVVRSKVIADPTEEQTVAFIGNSGVGKTFFMVKAATAALRADSSVGQPAHDAERYCERRCVDEFLRTREKLEKSIFNVRAAELADYHERFRGSTPVGGELHPTGQVGSSTTAVVTEFRQGSRFEATYEYRSERQLQQRALELARELFDPGNDDAGGQVKQDIASELGPLLEGYAEMLAGNEYLDAAEAVQEILRGLDFDTEKIPLSKDIRAVAGRILVVPSGFGGVSNTMADFAVSRYVAHILQGVEPNTEAWYPHRPPQTAADAAAIARDMLNRQPHRTSNYQSASFGVDAPIERSNYQTAEGVADNFLRQHQLKRGSASTGGDCQFDSLAQQMNAHQVNGRQDYSKEGVRKEIVDWLKANPIFRCRGEIINFLSLVESLFRVSWRDYLENMATPTEWGDYFTLIAAANCFGVGLWCADVWVVDEDSKKVEAVWTDIWPLDVPPDITMLRIVNIDHTHFQPVVDITGDVGGCDIDMPDSSGAPPLNAQNIRHDSGDPFQMIMQGQLEQARAFGEKTFPALRRITQFVQSRLPFRDLPWVDVPGTGDFDLLKQRARADELEKDLALLVVFVDEKGFQEKENPVIEALANWNPVKEWQENEPLRVAVVVVTKEERLKATLDEQFEKQKPRQRRILCNHECMKKAIPDVRRREAFVEALFSPDRFFFPDPNTFAETTAMLRQDANQVAASGTSLFHPEMCRFLGLVTQESKRHARTRLTLAREALSERARRDMRHFHSQRTFEKMNADRRVKVVAAIFERLKSENGWDQVKKARLAALRAVEMPDVSGIIDLLEGCVADAESSSTTSTRRSAGLFRQRHVLSSIRPTDSALAEVFDSIKTWSELVTNGMISALKPQDEEKIFLKRLHEALVKEMHEYAKVGDLFLEDEYAAYNAKYVVKPATTSINPGKNDALEAFADMVRETSRAKHDLVAAQELMKSKLTNIFKVLQDRLFDMFEKSWADELQRKILGPMNRETHQCLTNDKIKAMVAEATGTVDDEQSLLKHVEKALALTTGRSSLEDEAKSVVQGIRLECVREAVRGLTVFGPARNHNRPRDATEHDLVEDFDPEAHSKFFNTLSSSISDAETAFKEKGGIKLVLNANDRKSHGKKLINVLCSRSVYDSPMKPSSMLEAQLDEFARKWGNYLIKEAKYERSWNDWPTWLQHIVTLVDFYGRVANLYVVDGERGADGPLLIKIIRVVPQTGPDLHEGRADAILVLRKRNSDHFRFSALSVEQPVEPLSALSVAQPPPADVASTDDPADHSALSVEQPEAPHAVSTEDSEDHCILNRALFQLHRLNELTSSTPFPHFGSFATYEAAAGNKDIGTQDACDIAWNTGCVVLCDGIGSLAESGEWARRVVNDTIEVASCDSAPLMSATNRARRIADDALRRLATGNYIYGSTTWVVCALAQSGSRSKLHWLSVGDSFAALLRKADSGSYRCVEITEAGWESPPSPPVVPGTPWQLPCSFNHRTQRREIYMPHGMSEGTWPIEDGDVLVVFSDGIADNLGRGCDAAAHDIQDAINAALSEMPDIQDESETSTNLCEAIERCLIERCKQVSFKDDDYSLVVVEVRVGGSVSENVPDGGDRQGEEHGLSSKRRFLATFEHNRRGAKRHQDEEEEPQTIDSSQDSAIGQIDYESRKRSRKTVPRALHVPRALAPDLGGVGSHPDAAERQRFVHLLAQAAGAVHGRNSQQTGAVPFLRDALAMGLAAAALQSMLGEVGWSPEHNQFARPLTDDEKKRLSGRLSALVEQVLEGFPAN